MAHITITDNFLSDFAYVHNDKKNGVSYKYSEGEGCFKSTDNGKIALSLNIGQFKTLPNSTFLSLSYNESKLDDKSCVLLITPNASSEEKKWSVQSGNFVGSFQYDGHQIEIKSRFSDLFLARMLSVANNVFISDVFGQDSKSMNSADFILYLLFVQKLEKAFLLGLPKSYQKQEHHSANVKGKVNITRLISKDIPFKGKISTDSRERVVDENIISVLNQALSVIFRNNKTIAKNVNHVYAAIRQLNPKSYSRDSLISARTSRALSNPLFSGYRQVLDLAELIIKHNQLSQSKTNDKHSFGFLIDVAELYENYLSALLRKGFPDWRVESPEITIYQDTFFRRKIIPDIVMKKDNQVIVFDAKYKSMHFNGRTNLSMGDIDRSDFFQIHTYMSYYDSQLDTELIMGGLLYPFSSKPDNVTSSGFWGNRGFKFIVDGIDVSGLASTSMPDKEKFDNLIKAESMFIQRISGLLNGGSDNV